MMHHDGLKLRKFNNKFILKPFGTLRRGTTPVLYGYCAWYCVRVKLSAHAASHSMQWQRAANGRGNQWRRPCHCSCSIKQTRQAEGAICC